MHRLQTSPDSPQQRHMPHWLIYLPLLLALVIGGLVSWRWSGQQALEQQIAAIREAGEPVTLEELAAMYPEPAGENAAERYLEAADVYVPAGEVPLPEALKQEAQALATFADNWRMGRVDQVDLAFDLGEVRERRISSVHEASLEFLLPAFTASSGVGDLPEDLSAPIPTVHRRAMEEFIQANEQAIALILEAAAIPEARYPFTSRYSDQYDLSLDHLDPLRRLVALMMMRTILAADEGDADLAVESFNAAVAAIRSLNDEPAYHAWLTQLGLTARVTQTLERILHMDLPWTDQQLADLQRILASVGRPDGAARALMEVRVMDYADLQQGNFPAFRHSTWRRLIGYRERDKALVLHYLSRYIEAFSGPISERHDKLKAIHDELEALSGPRAIVAIVFPVDQGMDFLDRRALAQQRLGRTALALERYRLARGTHPDSLAALAPDWLDTVPEDPFDGQPLRYRRSDDDSVIYSVGRNREDHGGTPKDGEGRGDIIFTVPTSPAPDNET